MRVALLTYNARAGDALGRQIAEKIAFFLARGADVRVFLESDRGLEPQLRSHCHVVTATDLPRHEWDFLSFCDLVIAEFGQAYGLLGLLPLLAGGKPRILVDYHGVTPLEWWGAHNREAIAKGLAQRGLVWCADAALAHSRFAAGELLDSTGFPPERLFRLGYPIDMEHFSPGPPQDSFREQLGLGSTPIVLYVGRVAANKRVPVLVEALSHLGDVKPAVHAVVVGDTGDLYQREANLCLEKAAELGVADRFHLLGHVSDEQLLDAYRSANVLVIPSCHEGFCLPVIEAMACGLPVIAARAGALPETIGPAGLTFQPDDVGDLARQVRRVLAGGEGGRVGEWESGRVGAPEPSDYLTTSSSCHLPTSSTRYLPTSPTHHRTPSRPRPPATLPSCHAATRLRIAIVSFRYGQDFVGGAETSLRTIAETLLRLGCTVEVFTTCTKAESRWSNQLPEGTMEMDGIPVHRFRMDRHDRDRHVESVRKILQADGRVSREMEADYLRHSIHSARLLDALGRHIAAFDAVITGPYLHGLAFDVVQRFADKVILLPCLHDEPFARMELVQQIFSQAGGILFHSLEEQELAQSRLGLNHPVAFCCGILLDTQSAGDPESGRAQLKDPRRYVLYCGRYSPHKGLPALLEHARRYAQAHPSRFLFVFIGQGEVTIPAESWARDLGFVTEPIKRDVMAGADLLIQLSPYESLSLVALEAWAQGVPVLANDRCAVLRGHLDRGGGGRAVHDYDDFAAALDDLWDHPQPWQRLGRQGQEYVRDHYASEAAYAGVLNQAILDLKRPLPERMRRQGLRHCLSYSRPAWSEGFGTLLEALLERTPRQFQECIEVRPRSESHVSSAGSGTMLMPVTIVNRGTHAAVAEGPARVILRAQVFDPTDRRLGPADVGTVPLPSLLMPGRSLTAVVPVPVPAVPGVYRVAFGAEHALSLRTAATPDAQGGTALSDPLLPASAMRLIVEENVPQEPEHGGAGMLAAVQAALAEAFKLRQLPDDYLDVTEGWLATWKRWLKRKLLGNFKRAYVDVLARQQSAFNERVLAAIQELAEGWAILEHTGRLGQEINCSEPINLPSIRAALVKLDERLRHLEADVAMKNGSCCSNLPE